MSFTSFGNPTAEDLHWSGLDGWLGNPPIPGNGTVVSFRELGEMPDGFPGVVRMVLSDEDGAAFFFDELSGETEPFFISEGFSDFNPWFVADWRRMRREPMCLPSHVEWVFHTEEYAALSGRPFSSLEKGGVVNYENIFMKGNDFTGI